MGPNFRACLFVYLASYCNNNYSNSIGSGIYLLTKVYLPCYAIIPASTNVNHVRAQEEGNLKAEGLYDNSTWFNTIANHQYVNIMELQEYCF